MGEVFPKKRMWFKLNEDSQRDFRKMELEEMSFEIPISSKNQNSEMRLKTKSSRAGRELFVLVKC